MTTREVVLEGGSPWGFRMHGGVDVQQPLRISRVNPGSKAAVKGVREGDIISSINNQPTRDITNADAHILLKKSGDTLKLGLNEDCSGSPKRRQYKTVQQETHSESIERSSTSKSSYSSTNTSVTINRSRSDQNEPQNSPPTKINGQLEKNGEPENGIISQRSTLSSSCSSSPSAPSHSAEPRGIGIEIRQEARDTATRNNESSGYTTAVVTKPVSADNERDVIADTEMGGNSRSHKKRSRANRKKSKNSNVVSAEARTGETMVELPSSPSNSDVTECGNDVENNSGGNVASNDNSTENVEVEKIGENKALERIQINYRVESPETVSRQSNTSKKQNGGSVVKSKSLDDDDLVKITELSEASEGEDKSVTECSAVVSEADSDADWEVTEELKSEDATEEHGESLNTLSLPLEDLEAVHVTLISPEEETNLRNFLEGINLVTSPEEASNQTQKKEGYKERKARKRAAIAEHFMPVLQQPRFLDVICEEGSDNSDRDSKNSDKLHHPFIKSQEFVRKTGQTLQQKMESHFPKFESEKVVIVGGKLMETTSVQGTWSTSMAETSSSEPEVVYLDDSSTSKTPSDTSEPEDNDAEAEEENSKSEDISQRGSQQELNSDKLEKSQEIPLNDEPQEKSEESATTSSVILPPPSQLTPPPTPDLTTPKNEKVYEKQKLETETADFIDSVTSYLSKGNYSAICAAKKDVRFKDLPEDTRNKVDALLIENKDAPLSHEDAFNKEFQGFCDELNLQDPCKYVNAVSPPAPSRSPSVSSEGSSKTNSQCTARYNPMCSSIADVADLLKEEENAKDALKVFEPETLRELCLKELMSLPFGADVLEELAEVSQSIEQLTGTWQMKISPSLLRLRKHFNTPITPAFMSKQPLVDDTNSSFTVPVTKEEMPFNPSTKWVGMPTQEDPKVLVCLSPTQKTYLDTTKSVPNEAGKLLELHQKFISRRGYHEENQDTSDDTTNVKISLVRDTAEGRKSPKMPEFSNRLLAIIRESTDPVSDLHVSIHNSMQRAKESSNVHYIPIMVEGIEIPTKCRDSKKQKEPCFKEWLSLTRGKSASDPQLDQTQQFLNTSSAAASETYQSKTVNGSGRVQSSSGNIRSPSIPNRRFSLPQEVYERQIHYIREKEKQIQEEIEKLEKEKRKVISEMGREVPLRQFEAGKYHISKKGDIAIRNNEEEPPKTEHQQTVPMAPTEFFRQKMYDEYMRKVAAREERKLHKVIKISSSRTSQVEESAETSNMCEVTHVSGIEDEFMDKVKERMRKYGLNQDDSEETRKADANDRDDSAEPVLVMDGDSLKDAKELPKHLQEFVNITRRASDIPQEETEDGVWSPGQKSAEDKPQKTKYESQEQQKKDEPIPPVWIPRSAGSSPTAERKEFRPVNFESPVLGRRNKPKPESTDTPVSPSVQPPWQVPDGSSDVGVSLSSSLERRIPTSHSAPASGFTEFSSPRLPRAQNPTITLLQKAREGQLPRGASYIQTEPIYSYRTQDDRPPLLGPGEVLYQIKNEYTSESDSERPRKMADLGPRRYEVGIGPTTRDGMPLVLRSEVKDGNQSRWYKRMYDTIHKQKPDPRYPYSSGYFSEPEHSAFSAYYYDSDGTASDNKYATLDRRRLQPSKDKENDYMSSTLPRDLSNSDVIKHGQHAYKNQPGRIENYIPGRSSISEKEAKEWWDEVMDIFDGWLDDHAALPSYNYLLSRAITRSHLEQQKNVPQPRSYMSQALKESGYESDSTLVFRRREDAIQQLSPSEQREAYKNIQKGGDVPLHGLRKLAPERPKEDTDIEYFPISPTLTRIRIHKNVKPQNHVLCYPLSMPPHPRHIFSEYKRTAPSSVSSSSVSKPPSIPPSPPKRRSSRNSNTLRLISTMKVRTERSPSSKRHETCFTSTSDIDRNKVKYLKDKITCKLSPSPKRKGDTETKPRLKVTKTLSVSPAPKSSVTSTLSTNKASWNKISSRNDVGQFRNQCCLLRSSSASPVRKICKNCSLSTPKKVSNASIPKPKPGTFGSEKRKVDLVLPKLQPDKTDKLRKTNDLLSPTEVKKAVISQINSLPSGVTYRKSNALYSSVRNGLIAAKDKSLPVQVGISQRGRELLRPSQISSSLPTTPIMSRTIRARNTTPSPCPSALSEKSKSSSQKSQSTSLDSLKSVRTYKRDGTAVSKSASLTSLKSTKFSKQKNSKDHTSSENKKLKKSKKDQLNGEIVKRERKTKKPAEKTIKKCAGKAAGTEIVKQLRGMENDEDVAENVYTLTQDAIQKQREAIQTNSFFQNLFWRDIPSPPPPFIASQNSLIAEKTRLLQRNISSFSEPTIGALKIYLNHTKPVTDSKFRSLDAALMRSRSASPKSVTWKIDKATAKGEKSRSISLPPKLIFTETSRPVSPILIKRQRLRDSLERRRHDSERSVHYGPSPKLIFTETSRPVSPIIERKQYTKEKSNDQEHLYLRSKRESPSKLIFTETSRPVSPVVERKIRNQEDYRRDRSTSPSKLIFSETSRPVSPIITRKYNHQNHDYGVKKSASTSKLIFSETSRPLSPVINRKKSSKGEAEYSQSYYIESEKIRSASPTGKLYFTETSRPVSPVIERRYTKTMDIERKRSPSPSFKQFCTETSLYASPMEKDYIQRGEPESTPPVPAKLIFTETSRPVSPVVERRYSSQRFLQAYRERSPSPSTKLYFTETSRPVSPVIERKLRPLERNRSTSPIKIYSTEIRQSSSSPTVDRRYKKQQSGQDRSSSPCAKLFFTETSRPVSPIVEKKIVQKQHIPVTQERSFSPSSKLLFSETSRPVSPVIHRKYVRAPTPPSPTIIRSPSSRKISQTKTFRVAEELKKRPVRSRSADNAENIVFDDDLESTASTDLTEKEYKTYYTEMLHSPRRCSKFKELNKFYSTLERMGELERTTSSSELRPRRKYEEEIIDFDRWKEVHTRERAEKELETLYTKLKDDEREKGFLFRPKNIESYRWKRETDRGLRVKDKSVENIKENFEKLKQDTGGSVPDEIIFRRDLYKPLWRGSSVMDLASSMAERRSQSEGRVASIRKKLLESERLLTHGIGSRIWSSLSSEQINLLKGQLSEIYSHSNQKKYQAPPTDYSIDVCAGNQQTYKPVLSVRRNSDELVRRPRTLDRNRTSDKVSTSLVLSENEKRRLSQSLSREVMDRMSQRQKHRNSLSLVLGKETRGAIAVADANLKSNTSEVASPRTCYSLELSEDEKDKKHKDSDFVLVLAKDDSDAHKNNIHMTLQDWAQPKKALVSTDVTNRVTSTSETESGSTDESTKTVVYLGNKDAVHKKVEYFEQVAEERPYTPTIYRAAETPGNDGEPVTDTQQDLEIYHTEEVRQPRKLVPSQSYQDFKELFGEQEQNKFTVTNLTAARPPPPASGSSNASISKAPSNESLHPNRNSKMRTGEVQHLKNKFEHLEDFYGSKLTTARRSRSNPELHRKHQIIIPGQMSGEVDSLRRRYEYPWIFGRGRSRIRRGGVVSPIYFRSEDRYMPHINIISKIATLYPRKTVFLSDVRQKSAEELAKILGCPLGEVERLRRKFDSPERNISLLGHMFTSSPNVHELRDIAPYLTGSWAAHKYPKMEDNTRSLSSPEHSLSSWDTSLLRKDRPRPKSVSPPRPKAKLSPILKNRQRAVTENGIAKQIFDPRIHQPVQRFQPPCPKFEPVRYKSSWPQTVRSSVTFKEPEAPTPPPKGHHGIDFFETESPRKYVENEVTIHYKSPIRQEVKESLSEEELSRRQAEHMKRVYEEERRRKYLQELQDMNSRRHTDNFTPSQKSPIPLNRYDDFPAEDSPKIKPRPRSPEPRLVARALYNFVGQSARELTFRKGDIIYVRRQVDKNWYEGEHNAMIGLFPANYAEIIPYDGMKSTPRKNHEGQARAKFNFIAQTHLELSLAKGELVVVTRRVDDNWFEGRIGGRKGIFPVSYVEILIDPSSTPPSSGISKPVASPAAHSMLLNGSAGGKESMGSHSYAPSIPYQHSFASSYRAKPVQISGGNYGSLTKSTPNSKNPINEALHIDTHSEPIPYRALYKYRPQNDDELELMEGDVVYVLEKCDDGWYVGSSQRTGAFGTFPGNYVERI